MKRQKDDMQVNVAGFRRNIKNLAHNYSDAQVKVREATSNDPWGPSATIMAEVADLTYNVVAFSEIMQMIWKRLNDHGKNWRHVYKALILLEYLIKTGTEKVAAQCKENIFAIQTLKEFQYMEECTDQGIRVRDKAKQLVSLLKDDERLKNERTKALKAKERFAQNASGFGSDGSIDGPTHRESPSWRTEMDTQRTGGSGSAAASEIEYVRPQTVGEEELQLQLAMAMSREEAEQEEAKRRSDDVRLQLALSQSENDFNRKGVEQPQPKQESHLMDLLDISLGATAISSPTGTDAWGLPKPQSLAISPDEWPQADPWSRSSPVDPWQSSSGAAGPMRSTTHGTASVESWLSRTQSPSAASGSSVEGWLNNGSTPTAPSNGNIISGLVGSTTGPDPWLSKPAPAPAIDPWLSKSQPLGDPWQSPNINSNGHQSGAAAPPLADPWYSPSSHMGARPSPIGAQTSPNSDLDEFDVITNRTKTTPVNGTNNNNSSFLDELDPLSTKKPTTKTPQSFLGENSSLVNLDNLIKPAVPSSQTTAAYNPFGDMPQQKTNLFQQQTQPVPSINQLKQSPFPVTLNQDPWAPISGSNTNQCDDNNDANNNIDINSNEDDFSDIFYYSDFDQITNRQTSGYINNSNINNNPLWLKPEAASSNPFLT